MELDIYFPLVSYLPYQFSFLFLTRALLIPIEKDKMGFLSSYPLHSLPNYNSSLSSSL